MKRVYVLIGGFGSGKTELALNLAFRAARHGRTQLIDLDMVNTYFRLSERKRLIEAAEIRLVSPNYVGTNVETLSLRAEVYSAFHTDWDTVIFDVGGDPAGATALGRFHADFAALPPGSLEVLNVVNVRRPMTETAEKVIALMEDMRRNARLFVTGLVNNTNLARETSSSELPTGYAVLREVSERTGVPVRYTAGLAPVLRAFLDTGPDPRFVGETLEIDTYLHRDWDTYVKEGL